MPSNEATRLALAVLDRRTQLALSQLEVWQAGGPSNTTLTNIENGRLDDLTNSTAKKLDAGLQWERGTALGIWRGDDVTDAVVLTDSEGALVPVDDEAFIKAMRERVVRREHGEDRAMLGTLRLVEEMLERRPDLAQRIAAIRIKFADISEVSHLTLTPESESTDVSDPDETLPAAAKGGDIEPEGVEFLQ